MCTHIYIYMYIYTIHMYICKHIPIYLWVGGNMGRKLDTQVEFTKYVHELPTLYVSGFLRICACVQSVLICELLVHYAHVCASPRIRYYASAPTCV